MKGVHFLHAAEHQSFYKLGLLFLMEMAKFYGGPTLCIVTCFLAQPDCRTFLPEHCNAIIKQQLRGWGSPLPLLQVNVFQEKQGILQQIITPTFARVSQQFGFVRFPICLNLFSKIGICLFSYFMMSNFMGKKQKKLMIQKSFLVISFFYFFPMKFHIIK